MFGYCSRVLADFSRYGQHENIINIDKLVSRFTFLVSGLQSVNIILCSSFFQLLQIMHTFHCGLTYCIKLMFNQISNTIPYSNLEVLFSMGVR